MELILKAIVIALMACVLISLYLLLNKIGNIIKKKYIWAEEYKALYIILHIICIMYFIICIITGIQLFL